MDLGLGDRAAIVTGASRGIGRNVTLALVAEGCRVLACGRDKAALKGVVAETNGQATAMAIDISAPEAAAEIVERCQQTFDRLDILVNNAGGTQPKAIDQLTDADWREGFEVNFFAAARLAVACAPVMRDAGWGRMVHVASTSGREPDPWFAPYAAAKAALINLSTALSNEFSAHGVLSNCVLPGVTMTELVHTNAAASAVRTGSTPEEVMAKVLAKQGVASGRFGEPEEIAAAIVFLASEQASWITGATLEVDGGTLRSI